MVADLWTRKDGLEAYLTNELDIDPSWAIRELAEVEEMLGLREDGDPVHTGDPLADYWIARHMSGEIGPEDLELSPQDLQKMKRGR